MATTVRIAGKLDGVITKVTGRALYTEDLELSGMLLGKILRCNLPHARVKEVDTAKSERQPGVLAVLTGRVVKRLNGPYMGGSNREEPVLVIDRAVLRRAHRSDRLRR